MPQKPSDMTPVVDLTSRMGTGPMRSQQPIYVDLLPPCNHACPAGEDIQGWLALAQAGKYQKAWERLVRDNPLPAVHGRVCYHPCETSCNRKELDASVSIHAVERFLGDLAAAEGWKLPVDAPASGKARADRRSWSERPFRCLPPDSSGPHGRNPRSGASARRHATFRHSGLPPAARRLDEGDPSNRGDGCADRR